MLLLSPIHRHASGSLRRSDPNPALLQRQETAAVLRSPGQPLDSGVRAFMEPRFRRDFGGVRVHADPKAAESAEGLGAAAYTLGRHIVFGPGQYRPGTEAGRRLLAHELAHTVQQERARPQGLPRVDRPGGAMEREADRAASAVTGGRSAAVTPGSHVAIQRQPLAGAGASERLIENASPMLAAAIGSVTVDGFETGSADLDEKRMGRQIGELKKTARNIVVLLRKYTASKVSVTGHTDTVGTEANNLQLGMARATAVKAALVDLGVPEAIIVVASKGEGPPQAVKTRDEASSARNRRAEVRFQPESGPSLPGPPVYQPPTVYQPPPVVSPPFPGLGRGYSFPPPTVAPGPRAQPAPVSKVPPDVVRRITALEEALERTVDAAARDKLVRQIRDLVASIPQPFASKEDVVKGLDDAIKAGVTEGIKKAIQAALEAIAGQPATTMPSEPSHTLPLPSSAPGETIIPGPSIPFDYVPELRPRTTFQFSGGPRASYAPGATITFTLVPPANFHTMPGSKRVVIVAAADRAAVNPDRLAQVRIESGSKQSITLQAPSKPGKYVIRVDIGMSFEDSSMQEFEVKSPAP